MDKKPTNYGKKNGEINRQTEKKMILKKKFLLENRKPSDGLSQRMIYHHIIKK